MSLSFYLLGSPRIERNGAPVEPDTRKAVALLAYLVVSGQPHTREALATLLWPEADQSHGRAALRRTLSVLRRALGEESLEVDREMIGLKEGLPHRADVTEFERLLAQARTHEHPDEAACPECISTLARAAALYRGEFLAGFTLRDSPAFDDWQFFEADRLRCELAGALERLARAHGERREYAGAIQYARRWLALDPLREAAHRWLMLLYARDGQRGAALRQYRECVRVLGEELGVPPLEETVALHEAIRENRLPTPAGPEREVGHLPAREAAPAPRATGARAAPGAPWPMIGRAGEWGELLAAYQRIAGRGHLLALEGEAGIGKTRLAEEFLARVRGQGAVTLEGRCYPGESGLAYGPFVEAIRAALLAPTAQARLQAVPPVWPGEAARLLPELSNPAMQALPADGPAAQARLFEALRQVIAGLCASDRPGVLFLDDVQWADASSLELLAYLARRLHAFPVLLLCAWREEGNAPESALQALLSESWRSGSGTSVRLDRLTRDEVSELACAALDLPAPLARQLYEETEGLPFLVVEYLTTAAGAPDGDRGDWLIPRGVQEWQRARLSGLDDLARQLLTTAAAIGRSFDFDTLREASGRSEVETVAGLETLLRRGLVRERRGTDAARLDFDFSHENLREVVYGDTSRPRQRLSHRRIAATLIRQARRLPSAEARAGQIARHLLLAGLNDRAAEYFRQAGEHARRVYANAEALEHFQAALSLGHPAVAGLHEAIGDLQTLRGEYGSARISYQTALSLEPLPRLKHRLGNLHHRCGEWELAARNFREALELPAERDNPGLRARVYADWSRTAYQQGHPDQARRLAQQSLDLARTEGGPADQVQAHNILGILARVEGDYRQAQQHLERALATAEEASDNAARVAALNNLALAYADSGAHERAIAAAQTALHLCVHLGDRHRQAALLNNLADLYHATGQEAAALEHLKQAVGIFAEIGQEAGAARPEIWKLTEW